MKIENEVHIKNNDKKFKKYEFKINKKITKLQNQIYQLDSKKISYKTDHCKYNENSMCIYDSSMKRFLSCYGCHIYEEAK